MNGVYRDPLRGVSFRFQGVAYQEQRLFLGLYFGANQIGLFDGAETGM